MPLPPAKEKEPPPPHKPKKLSLIRRRFTVNYEPSICRSPRRRRASNQRAQDNATSNKPSPLWTPLDQVDQARRRNQTSTSSSSTSSSSSTNALVSSHKPSSSPSSASILFNSFIAGALAGSLADITVHPIDTINTRLKVSSGKHLGGTLGYVLRTIYTEGFSALYKGIGPTIYQTLPMNAVWFGTYEYSKKVGTEHCPVGYEPLVHLSSGALGELTSSIFYVPFDVVKTRMQLGENPHEASRGTVGSVSNYNNTWDAFNTIYRKEGVRGLYSGYKACILADCSMQALQFMFYERMKTVLLKNKKAWHEKEQLQAAAAAAATNTTGQLALDAKEIFFCGAVSGGTAAFLTNPVDTVTARLMTQGYGAATTTVVTTKDVPLLKYSGVWQCAQTIVREEGAQSLMRGWLPRTLRFSVLGALTLAVYEKLRDIMGFEDEDD